MFLTAVPFAGFRIKTIAATNGKTQTQAVEWATSKSGGISLDHDGVYGAQCVDLIRYYYSYLGATPVSGSGCDYSKNALPAGWSRIQYYNGFVAQPGDVAVWTYTTSANGHVAIVTSATSSSMSVVEQNGSTGVTRTHSYSYSYGTFWGVIRPDFENYTSPPSSLSVEINKYVLNIDESFTITCFANDADHYWIGFYLDNVLIKDTVTNSGVATVTLAKQGKYSVVVSAINSQGEINAYSSVVVGDASDYIPETPDVILSSYVLDVGEQLTISFSSNKVEEYWLGIYKNGVLIKSLTPTNNEYITSFDEVGKYSVTVTAINKFGETYKNIWFTIGKYDIIYDANDCSNVPSAQTKAYGTDLILSSTKPIKQNYNFIEWNTKPDGTGVSYQPGDTYSENADLTLYAIWELDHEHEYISEVTQQPTCTEKGVKAFTCSLCNDVYYEDVDELGHDYVACVTEPTCTEQGFTTYECSRCDDSYTENYIEPLNHSSSSWHTAINPTAISEGLAEKLCDYCGIVLDQFTIPCLAPDYVTGITLSSEKETVKIGDTFTLSATVIPDTAKNKNVIWSSRNPEIVSVNNGKVTAIKPGTTAIVVETEDGGYIDFCLVRVISLVAFNGAVIDNDRNIIYGLSSNLESVDDYLITADDSMTVNLSTSTVGTGTFINVMDNGEVVDLYEAVIFGDVNGDSWYDGQDAVLVSCLANGMLTKEDVGEAVYTAADCNHDGIIDQLDVDLLNQAGTLLAEVDQSKTNEELFETSSIYVEYLDLIDQSPEVESDVNEKPENGTNVPQESEPSPSNKFVVFILDIIAALKFAFDFIISIFKV